MNIIRCKNGHFYDADTFADCPHCNPKIVANKPEKKAVETPPQVNDGSDPTEPKEIIQPVKNDDIPTAAYWDNGSKGNIDTDTGGKAGNTKSEDETPTSSYFDNTAANSEIHKDDVTAEEHPHAEPVNNHNQPEKPKEDSLKDMIKRASANSAGKTVGYFSVMTGGGKSQETAESSEQTQPIDPVVGWLVCVDGVYFGESFKICAGVNSIGRSDSNRIALTRDGTVSRERHAAVIYDPRNVKFYVKPGEGNELTYLNDDCLFENSILSKGDIITLGACRLMFVPLCGEDFLWEKYIKKEQ